LSVKNNLIINYGNTYLSQNGPTIYLDNHIVGRSLQKLYASCVI